MTTFEHELKTTDQWFRRVKAGEKTAEIRQHDRDFQVGDRLLLTEVWGSDGRHTVDGETAWHRKGEPTGDQVLVWITHVLPATHFSEGLQPGYCLLSFHLVEGEPFERTHYMTAVPGWHRVSDDPEDRHPDCEQCREESESPKESE
jgi:hypothetical protein